jgi:hypothetical protein
MRDSLLLAVQLVVTFARLMRPGGVRAIIAESLILKHQLQISRRSRRRVPRLTTVDRFVLGLTMLFVSPRRCAKLAAILKPATLLRFHRALVDRKYRYLFSSPGTRRKPGPKGPSEDLVTAIVELKSRNPCFSYQRIAEQISRAFGVEIDKDVVRRVLAMRYRPEQLDTVQMNIDERFFIRRSRGDQQIPPEALIVVPTRPQLIAESRGDTSDLDRTQGGHDEGSARIEPKQGHRGSLIVARRPARQHERVSCQGATEPRDCRHRGGRTRRGCHAVALRILPPLGVVKTHIDENIRALRGAMDGARVGSGVLLQPGSRWSG